MNRIIGIAFLATALCLFMGCEKSSAGKKVDSSIVGSWELKQRQAGMTPTADYADGNGNILKFTATTYERFENGHLAESGTYTIVRDDSAEENTCLVVAAGEYENRIDFGGDNRGQKVFMQLADNELQFLSGCFALDAGTHSSYKKLGILAKPRTEFYQSQSYK